MFTILFGTFAVIMFILMCFGFYIFAAFVFSRLGEKFRIGSFFGFLIPIYNVMLLCDCAKISRWITLGIVAPGIVTLGMNVVSFYLFAPVFEPATALISFAANVYLWGSIAQRLGKNFWLWGILTPVLVGLPVLIMAFDGSMPVDRDERGPRENVSDKTRYIDI
ncbi:MAG: hypothetical protein LLF78_06685 [Synergistaceae bacterium]|nr:hypothetical protein [Synergistaceae bacterium]